MREIRGGTTCDHGALNALGSVGKDQVCSVWYRNRGATNAPPGCREERSKVRFQGSETFHLGKRQF